MEYPRDLWALAAWLAGVLTVGGVLVFLWTLPEDLKEDE